MAGGESIMNMSYTGDFVSQNILRQSIQKYGERGGNWEGKKEGITGQGVW